MPVEIREIITKTDITSAPEDADNLSQVRSKLKKSILQYCLAQLKRMKNKYKR
ncbi:MAG: hypothetical protein ACJAVN_002920 [Roseivirga sp.]|jgi:hypothetical protein